MIKKLQIASLIMLVMVLVVSCAPKPVPTTPPPDEIPEAPADTTGEATVDEVAEDISEAGNADEGLDTSELDDVDSILEDIGNI